MGRFFFKDKLELKISSHDENMARFEIGSFPIFMAKSERGSGSFISIETDDIEADYTMLSERGIEFREPVIETGDGGKVCFFKGPGDTEFMLYQAPHAAE